MNEWTNKQTNGWTNGTSEETKNTMALPTRLAKTQEAQLNNSCYQGKTKRLPDTTPRCAYVLMCRCLRSSWMTCFVPPWWKCSAGNVVPHLSMKIKYDQPNDGRDRRNVFKSFMSKFTTYLAACEDVEPGVLLAITATQAQTDKHTHTHTSLPTLDSSPLIFQQDTRCSTDTQQFWRQKLCCCRTTPVEQFTY